MTRYKIINNERIAFTAEEETARDKEEEAVKATYPAERMKDLRRQRDALLVETDFMGNSDLTMSDAWKTYRQALRDITSQTPVDDVLSNITFPTKPS